MKIAALIARILQGLLFCVFGLNGFLHFIPMGPLPPGLAGQFAGVLMQSHYFVVVSALQLAGGALLLLNRFVPLALTLLGPVIVNILLFHLLMDPKGIGAGVVVTILWVIIAVRFRKYFSGIFVARADV
jgi:putative oxidoreductase